MEKANSKSSTEHSSLFKESLSKLKTRFRHFQFFSISFKPHHIRTHMCSECTHTDTGACARHTLSHIKRNKRKAVCHLVTCSLLGTQATREKQCPLHRGESTPETPEGTKRLSQNRGIPSTVKEAGSRTIGLAVNHFKL